MQNRGGSATRAEDEWVCTRYNGTGINTPDSILRRGAVEAMMDPWVIGAAEYRVSRRTCGVEQAALLTRLVCSSRDQQGRKIGAGESSLEPRVPAPPLPNWVGLNSSLLSSWGSALVESCSPGHDFDGLLLP